MEQETARRNFLKFGTGIALAGAAGLATAPLVAQKPMRRRRPAARCARCSIAAS